MSSLIDPSHRPPASLLVCSGVQEGTRIPLVGEQALVGRSPGSDVRLADEGVSREHALLSFDPSDRAWLVEDLQSTNGTRVNGKRVRSSPLQTGDELQIGSTRLRFELA